MNVADGVVRKCEFQVSHKLVPNWVGGLHQKARIFKDDDDRFCCHLICGGGFLAHGDLQARLQAKAKQTMTIKT